MGEIRVLGYYNRSGESYVGYCSFLVERPEDEVSVRLLTYPEYEVVSEVPVTMGSPVRKNVSFAIPIGHLLTIRIRHAGAKYNYAVGKLLNDPEEQPGLYVEHDSNIRFALENDDAHQH